MKISPWILACSSCSVHHRQDVNVEHEINPPSVNPSEILGKAGTEQSILWVRDAQNSSRVIKNLPPQARSP